MPDGVVIVYVPDRSYSSVVPDPHCTLAYFGKMNDFKPWQIEVLRSVTSDLAELKVPYATLPKVTGGGVFALDPTFNDGNRYCYVDLIDWNVFGAARQFIEENVGFGINRGHGHLPHITRAYSAVYVPEMTRPPVMYPIRWASVDLWAGDEQTSFPLNTL